MARPEPGLGGEAPTARDWGLLGLILGLALAMRLPLMGGPLWYDEIQTVLGHLRLSWAEMWQHYSMNYHYLHNLEAKAVIGVWGEANWAIRLPALLFGLGSIWAGWALAFALAGRRVAHLLAVLLALSFHHIWFSTNARGYTELAFWSTLGTILWLRGMRTPTRGVWLGYGLTLTLATFTHLTGAFLYAAQGLIWLALVVVQAAQGRAERAAILWPVVGYTLGGVLTILLYLPLLPAMTATLGGVADTSAVDVMKEYQNPLWTVAEAIRTGLGAAGPLVLAVGALVLVLVLAGAVAARHVPLFAPMVLAHIVLMVGLLLALGMRIWPRFFFPDIAFLLLLIVLGVQVICAGMARLPILDRVGRLLFPLAAVGMVVISTGLALRNYTAPKQDLAGAVAEVAAQRLPGERVYAVGPAEVVFRDYFGAEWTPLETEAELSAALAEPGPLMLVVAFPGRMFRTLPEMGRAEAEGRLMLLADLPGTLGDGHIAILRRPG